MSILFHTYQILKGVQIPFFFSSLKTANNMAPDNCRRAMNNIYTKILGIGF